MVMFINADYIYIYIYLIENVYETMCKDARI